MDAARTVVQDCSPDIFLVFQKKMLSSTIMVILKRNTKGGVLDCCKVSLPGSCGEVNSVASILANFCCQLIILRKQKQKETKPHVDLLNKLGTSSALF